MLQNSSYVPQGLRTVDEKAFLVPPATKLGQGNIFSSVCQEFCPQGGAYLGRYPPRQVHPWAGTPLGRYISPWGQVPPWTGTPPMVNEQTVRILLECILVTTRVCR